MTRYFVLPTFVVFSMGFAVGWAMHDGRATPRDVWDDAKWWSKGFTDGAKAAARGVVDGDAKPMSTPTLRP